VLTYRTPGVTDKVQPRSYNVLYLRTIISMESTVLTYRTPGVTDKVLSEVVQCFIS
jgi:hypothetical protein